MEGKMSRDPRSTRSIPVQNLRDYDLDDKLYSFRDEKNSIPGYRQGIGDFRDVSKSIEGEISSAIRGAFGKSIDNKVAASHMLWAEAKGKPLLVGRVRTQSASLEIWGGISTHLKRGETIDQVTAKPRVCHHRGWPSVQMSFDSEHSALDIIIGGKTIDAASACRIFDPGGRQLIRVNRSYSITVVVANMPENKPPARMISLERCALFLVAISSAICEPLHQSDKRAKRQEQTCRHDLFQTRETIAMVQATLGLDSDESLQIALCVDTCAGTAGGILSTKLVNRLSPALRSRYRPGSDWSQRTLLEAYDGHAHTSPDGHIDLETTVGSCTETIRYLVCSAMAQDAILGVGGIERMGLVVDLPNARVLTANPVDEVPFISEESVFLLSKSRVSDVDACLCEDVVIPPRSVRLVKVRVRGSSYYANTTWTAAVVEDDQTAIEHQAVAAHGVVEIVEGTATILMSNLGTDPILLPQGRVVAVFKPRTRIEINAIREPNRKSQAHAQQNELSPDELAKHKKDVMEALEIEKLGLNEVERAAVELKVEQNIMQFASEHNPLSRTNSAKHQIETGDAPKRRKIKHGLFEARKTIAKESLQILLCVGVHHNTPKPCLPWYVRICPRNLSHRGLATTGSN